MLENITRHLQAVALPDLNTTQDLGQFISSIYTFSLAILGVIIFVRFVWAGWLYFASAANASLVNRAKEMMKNAIIGAIILVAAYLILYIINPDLTKPSVELKTNMLEVLPKSS